MDSRRLRPAVARSFSGRLPLAAAVAALLCLPSMTALDAQVRPIYSLGASGVLQQMLKLRTTASVLHTAAHPDDEDSPFIARVARADYGRVAYLSLNRGEGGQNVIGPELFDALGVIRTEELLQARTLDGGEQFFTQTFDYGFSKSMEEAAAAWNEQRVLGDMVRVIRTYRPLVIYSRFAGTSADGHGHHQLAGKLTPLAYKAAADPTQFPEQIKDGLRPWQAKKLYKGAGFRPTPGVEIPTRVETGRFDPLIGRSPFEIAAEGRSQHKSQEMGVPESRGPQQSGLILLESTVKAPATETSVFDGIDTSLQGLPALVGLPAGVLSSQLAAADRALAKAVESFNPRDTAASVPLLAEALTQFRAARSALTSTTANADAKADAEFLLAIKERDAIEALRKASGTVVDAVSDVETIAAGETFGATVRVFIASPAAVTIGTVTLRTPGGWTVKPSQPAAPDSSNMMARFFRETADNTSVFSVTVAANATPTQPYWLTTSRKGPTYTWQPGVPVSMPFAPALVTADVEATIGGVRVILSQPIQYRLIDQVRGELRRNLEVMPAVTVNLDSLLEVVPTASLGQPRRVAVRLQNNALTAQAGSLALALPAGWTASPASAPFSLPRKGDRTAIAFSVVPAKTTAPGRYAIKATATVGTATFDQGVRTLTYPHIQTHRLYAPAEAQVRVFDVKVAPVTVGYIMGSGDQVPDALRRLGLPVTELTDEALGAADLSGFNTIVVGIRASEARPAFVANNGRLLDFVKNGGTLVVQYQQPDFAARGLAPFPVQMASRVTDETAPVKILAPTHPAFTTPNTITTNDFADWVQERNLYAFTTFDPQFTPLLESADPGEAPQTGGEVYARLGKGHYVYTAYAWFRQLPAGVPGAYRQFANLVSLGATR
jgi:LmbE family N-acetylglucosaminyl deacetylase